MTDRRLLIMQAAVRVIALDGVRGLRVEKLAAEAGVSTALIYYHFTDRSGILHAALEHVNDRARAYTEPTATATDACTELRQMLLAELPDPDAARVGDRADEVRITSIAWGELRASAVFDPILRDSLRAATEQWNADVAAVIGQITDPPGGDSDAIAIRLTALVEGLSQRVHSGSLAIDEAHRLLAGAIDVEVGTIAPGS